ncbi:MAG: hypothetical protein J7497_04360 [Chitinophagaceae bacterium]|nr:hypothetical protein [Chitinophagaceae bacterium]
MSKKTCYLIVVVVVALSASCSSTNRMSLSVQEPAPVSLPSNIKNVAIVNRSNVSAKDKAVDITDKIFSLEGVELDKAGAAAGIDGLSLELQRDPRFKDVQVLSEQLTTLNPTVFPTPLSWDIVDELCRKYKVDALFSLELFDTDSKISYAAHPVKLNTPVGSIPGLEHEASMNTLVKTGWRIYDPSSKLLLDEFAIAQNIGYTGRGINPVVAANALIGRKEAVKEVANKSGQAYGLRVVPYWLRVWRDYYVRGTDNFKIAKRRAQTGNWDQAAELWFVETKNYKAKVAGRACYNMAIISEINGDLEKAIYWAQRAYEDYNNKLALRYVHILQNRERRTQVLKDQELAAQNSK